LKENLFFVAFEVRPKEVPSKVYKKIFFDKSFGMITGLASKNKNYFNNIWTKSLLYK
jgi:hypothetical protein